MMRILPGSTALACEALPCLVPFESTGLSRSAVNLAGSVARRWIKRMRARLLTSGSISAAERAAGAAAVCAGAGPGGSGTLGSLGMAKPGMGLGTSFGAAGSAAQSWMEASPGKRVRSAIRVFIFVYKLPDCIIRGPMRKMGSMEPVKTTPMSPTAIANVIKLITWVKSAMMAAVSSS